MVKETTKTYAPGTGGQVPTTGKPLQETNEATETTISQDDYQTLKNQIEELKRNLTQLNQEKPATEPYNASNSGQQSSQESQQNNPQVTAKGLIGTFEKYSVNPKHYPSPIERLMNEPKLKRFAFKDNYELNFVINISSYETQDGIREKQPKFTLQEIPIIFEEDGLDHGRRYIKREIVLHEEPETALIMAAEAGIDVDKYTEKAFLDEMRYMRMRDWLLEDFYPTPKGQANKKKQQTVINNQVVEIYEINGNTSQTIPFGDLQGKIRA